MESRKIKGMFFDFDGVITLEKNGTPTMISYIAKETNIPYEVIDSVYRKYNKDLLLGNITHEEMWESFCDAVGKNIDYKVLEESFLNITLDKKMIRYIIEKREEYLIGMITDNKADRINAIINQTELNGLFDIIIISADVHSRKSDKKIFEEALRQSGLPAKECVFIDNTLSNLVIPKEMGFLTVFFDDEKRELDELIY